MMLASGQDQDAGCVTIGSWSLYQDDNYARHNDNGMLRPERRSVAAMRQERGGTSSGTWSYYQLITGDTRAREGPVMVLKLS